jgi:hypothetical protein
MQQADESERIVLNADEWVVLDGIKASANAAQSGDETTGLQLLYRALDDAAGTRLEDSLVVAHQTAAFLDSFIRRAHPPGDLAYADAQTVDPGFGSRTPFGGLRGAAAKQLGQHLFSLLDRRWRGGSLFTPTHIEAGWHQDRAYIGAALYISIAADAMSPSWRAGRQQVLRLVTLDELMELRAVHGALLAALELDARLSDARGGAGPAQAAWTVAPRLLELLRAVWTDAAMVETLRFTSLALTPAQAAALRQLEQRAVTAAAADAEAAAADVASQQSAADAAQHTLRRCTLPSCGETEAIRKAFRVCGRCRSAPYCCDAHATQDWRRHKHQGCSAAN